MAKHILFITSNRLGDAVLSTGALDYVIAREPDARITVACGALPAPLFAAVPNLAGLLVMRKHATKTHWLRLWLQTATTRWHRVIDLRGSATAWFLLAGERIVDRGRKPGMHRVEEIAAVMGLAAPPRPRLWIAPGDVATARAHLPAGRPVVCLAPTANHDFKEWPHDRFAALARRLRARDGLLPGATLLLAGAPDELPRVRALIDCLPAEAVRNLYGQPLPAVAAAISQADLFVGNDSGLMHLAAAAGVATLGLFGPTSAQRYAPWGPLAAHVSGHPADAEGDMDDLTLAAVLGAAEALLARRRGERAGERGGSATRAE